MVESEFPTGQRQLGDDLPTKADYEAAWIAAVAVIGGLILQAYEISTRAQNSGNISDAMKEVKAGLASIGHQLDEISSKLDLIVQLLANLINQVSRVIDEQLYKRFLARDLSIARTALQNLSTYLATPSGAWSRRQDIRDALTTLQTQANLVLDSGDNPRRALDAHLQAAPLVAQWRTCWDTNERLWQVNSEGYEPIWAVDHGFFAAYRAAVVEMLDNCQAAVRSIEEAKQNWEFVSDNSVHYEFDSSKKFGYRFRRLGFPNSTRALRYDPSNYQMPLLAQAPPFIKWLGAAIRRSDGSLQRNAELYHPDYGLRAALERNDLTAWSVAAVRTMEQIGETAKVREKLKDALQI